MSIAPQVLLEVVPLRAALVADAHNWVHLVVAVGIDAVDDAGQSTMVERLTDIRVSAKSSVGSRFECPALTTVNRRTA
ncbi:MAG: hypothetical protein JSR75_12445 [Proteobacteria bacterium]|nr:hypothetical protein [Pseudomonadota bacterium]